MAGGYSFFSVQLFKDFNHIFGFTEHEESSGASKQTLLHEVPFAL
jgi:hypothetical protein